MLAQSSQDGQLLTECVKQVPLKIEIWDRRNRVRAKELEKRI